MLVGPPSGVMIMDRKKRYGLALLPTASKRPVLEYVMRRDIPYVGSHRQRELYV